MRVLRYDVPVDDQEHIVVSGRVVHVDCRAPDVVTLWALESAVYSRTYRVFGTGQPIPDGDNWEHIGTALSPHLDPFSPRGALVWHLFESAPF